MIWMETEQGWEKAVGGMTEERVDVDCLGEDGMEVVDLEKSENPRATWSIELVFAEIPPMLRGAAYVKAAQVMAQVMEEAGERIHRMMPQVGVEWNGTGVYEEPPF